MVEYRKVDHANRITLPSSMLRMLTINSDDTVRVSNNGKQIIIEKHNPEFVCAITGKITDKGKMIGNSFISHEGIEKILNLVNSKVLDKE